MSKVLNGSLFYNVLSPYIGKPVTVKSDGRKTTLPLSIFTAQNGNEGWQVGEFKKGKYILFSPSIIKEVVVGLDTVEIRLVD